jgi:hypothetical protein
MSAAIDNPPVREHAEPPALVVEVAIGWFAVYHLVLAVFMAAAPHTFYTAIGPFGPFNGHYVRDLATYNAAIAVALVVSLARPSWRVPLLALVTVQFALHSVNHLLDAGAAHPVWTGWLDFATLAASTLLLAWILRAAAAAESHAAGARGEPR